jgi:hypothetical protein
MRLADNRRRALAAAMVLVALLALGFLLGTATTARNGNPVSSEQLTVAERQAQTARIAQSTAVAARAAAATSSAHASRLAAQLALVRSCIAPRHTAVMRCVRAALR